MFSTSRFCRETEVRCGGKLSQGHVTQLTSDRGQLSHRQGAACSSDPGKPWSVCRTEGRREESLQRVGHCGAVAVGRGGGICSSSRGAPEQPCHVGDLRDLPSTHKDTVHLSLASLSLGGTIPGR